MKFVRLGLGLATILVICMFQLFLGTSAYAKSASQAKYVSVTTTMPLYVDCKQHPSAAILKNWAKYHICGYSSISNTAVIPNGVSQGNCGSVTNTLVNHGGGIGQSIVVVSVPWYSGGMSTAYYAGTWYSSSGLSGNTSDASTSFGFSWTSKLSYYMDTGEATVLIAAEGAQTVLLGNCTLVNPIVASANITG